MIIASHKLVECRTNDSWAAAFCDKKTSVTWSQSCDDRTVFRRSGGVSDNETQEDLHKIRPYGHVVRRAVVHVTNAEWAWNSHCSDTQSLLNHLYATLVRGRTLGTRRPRAEWCKVEHFEMRMRLHRLYRLSMKNLNPGCWCCSRLHRGLCSILYTTKCGQTM